MRAQNVVRWLLQRYWRLSRGLTLAVAGLVLDEGGHVLLVRDEADGTWRLPGGLVVNNERAGEALQRHLAAEAGIFVRATPRLLALDAGQGRATGDHIAVYVIEAWKRRAVGGASRRTAETTFFPLRELPSVLAPGTREWLLRLADGRWRHAASAPDAGSAEAAPQE